MNAFPGGLSVTETQRIEEDRPPTAPRMPLYLDSPGHSVVLRGHRTRILIPPYSVRFDDFRVDAVTAYLEANQSDESRPTVDAYAVYHMYSVDLSLLYAITRE